MPPDTKQKPNVQVLKDADAVARRCLEIFVDAAKRAVKAKGVFHLAISGGHSPERFFKLSGDDAAAKNLPWDRIHVFWVDERYVPYVSSLSNYKLAADTFLTKIAIPKENIHPIPTDLEDFNEAARQYEETLRSVFQIEKGQIPKFDLIILGMGADGHTASLFPGSNALFDTKDLACAVNLSILKPQSESLRRITLTHPVLCAAKQLIILVTGAEKTKILKEILASPPDNSRYPVHLLWPALERIIWLVDSDAGKLL